MADCVRERAGHAAVVFRQSIYMTGGFSIWCDAPNTVEQYSFALGKWKELSIKNGPNKMGSC